MITRLKTQKGNIEVRRDFSKEGMTQVRNHSFNHIRVLIKSYRKLNVSSYQKNDRISNISCHIIYVQSRRTFQVFFFIIWLIHTCYLIYNCFHSNFTHFCSSYCVSTVGFQLFLINFSNILFLLLSYENRNRIIQNINLKQWII